jgi:hemolysin-activating ACP:hemolysin acyltransferase
MLKKMRVLMAVVVVAGAANALPPDTSQAPAFSQQQLGGAASKLVSASVGDIAVVFSRSQSHEHYALADIQWMIVPPVVLGQFYVAELEHKEHGVRAPVAAVTWAHVSPEVDQRLRAQDGERVKLAPTEWNSGEITWLIDMAGEPAALAATLRKLNVTTFASMPVHVWTVNSSGEKQVLMLSDILKHARSDGAAA